MAVSQPSLASRLVQVLSDHDIAFITQAVDRDSLDEEVNAEWLTRFARAIEAAVLARLAKQQPVAAAWMQHGAVVEVFPAPPTQESEQCTNNDAHWTAKGFTQTPLYTSPRPIRHEQALRVALEEMDYANQIALQSLGVEIINPKTIAALRAELG